VARGGEGHKATLAGNWGSGGRKKNAKVEGRRRGAVATHLFIEKEKEKGTGGRKHRSKGETGRR